MLLSLSTKVLKFKFSVETERETETHRVTERATKRDCFFFYLFTVINAQPITAHKPFSVFYMHTDLLAHLTYTMCMHPNRSAYFTYTRCMCMQNLQGTLHTQNVCTQTLQRTIAYTKCPHTINSAYFYIHTMHLYAKPSGHFTYTKLMSAHRHFNAPLHTRNVHTQSIQRTFTYTQCICMQKLQGILHTHNVCTLTFQRTLHTHRVCTQTLQCTLHTQFNTCTQIGQSTLHTHNAYACI